VDLLLVQDGGGQAWLAGLGDEDLARLVDPDLLHLRVVEEGLQRADADDPVGHGLGHLGEVEQQGRLAINLEIGPT